MTNINISVDTRIKNPYVQFALCKKAYDNFVEIYNKDKEWNEKLRSCHHELFYKLIRFFITQLSKNKALFLGSKLIEIDPYNPPSLYTNNKLLGNELKRDTSTIYRQLERLITAEVIQKKYHGPNRSYEIFFNPDFLLITDVDNPKFIPQSEYLQKKENCDNNGDLKKDNIANCNQYQNIQETKNNIIISVDKLIKKCFTLNKIQPETFLTGNTGASIPKKYEKPDSSIKKYSARLRDADEKKKELKKKYAQWLLIIALKFIWKNKTIYEGEKQRTLQYISENYFEHCKSEKSLINTLMEFRWRLETAGRYIHRKEGFELNIYPYHYFNLNNMTGFRGTKKWYSLYCKRQLLVNNQRKKTTDNEKLLQQLKLLTIKSNIKTYQKCEDYVKSNIPNLLDEFYQTVSLSNYTC